jgi:hypothetical protein
MDASNGKCPVRRRDGEPCRNEAGKGTPFDHGPCYKHGGNLPGPQKAAAKRELAKMGHSLGVPIDVPPTELQVIVVRQAAGALQWATDRVTNDPSPENVALHAQAMDRASHISAVALKAGIAERRLRMAQRMGALIASAVEGAISDAVQALGIDVTPEFRLQIAGHVERRLIVLEQGEDDVIEGSAADG